MRILVTGGSGFIASYFYEPLRAGGHDMVNLDLVSPSEQARPYRHIKGDVRDRATLEQAMKGCDAVLHLAAAHHDFGIERDTYFSVNERGTKLITEVMGEQGVRDIVFYSTVAVYGDAPEPHHENAPMVPVSPYGQSKLAGEKVLAAWTNEGGNGRRALVIRPTVTFGPRNFANMYSLIRQISKGRGLLVGDGNNIKSLSYVENIVDATCQLWGAAPGSSAATGSTVAAVGPGFHVYNYIDKPDFTSRQIMETICTALGRRGPTKVPMWVATLGALPFDVAIKLTGKNLPISSARVKKLFAAQTKFEADKVLAAGYKPKVPLSEGIAKMTRWYVEQGRHQSPAWNVPPAQPVRA